MKNRTGTLAILTWLMAITQFGFGQGINLPDWKVLSEENKTTELSDTVFLGKTCVKLDGSIKSAIWNKAMNFANFRMELDVAGAVMSGIGFHVKDDQNYQFIYFRPGYGGTDEAVQYIPIYNGALSWVMYGKYQSNADIKKLEWFHASIEVRGNNLKVFTNYNKKPDLDIMILSTSVARGSILLRTMFGTSYFANVSIRPLPEYITDWEISEQMPVGTPCDYNQTRKVKSWKKINEAGDTYVNLCRYFEHPNGILFARHNIHNDSEESRVLNFDFAGKLRILLNGKEIFFYDKFKLDRIEESTNRIRLNLVKGDNELIFLTEGDGYLFSNGKGYNSLGRLQYQNWGFIASLNAM
ncbi:MAG TPA: family 16 glycoside hydrolase [Puia sp.]|nr:family 16 glycoside hydrolase [Puia sp.]